MYVTRVPGHSSPPAVLLRESFREDARSRRARSHALAGCQARGAAAGAARRDGDCRRRACRDRAVTAARSCCCGARHAACDRSRPRGLLPRRPDRLPRLALALIVARMVEPAPALATARQLSEATAAHSLGAVLGVGEVDEDELNLVFQAQLSMCSSWGGRGTAIIPGGALVAAAGGVRRSDRRSRQWRLRQRLTNSAISVRKRS